MGNPKEHFGQSSINQNYELIGINILRGDTTFEIKILLFNIFSCYKICCIWYLPRFNENITYIQIFWDGEGNIYISQTSTVLRGKMCFN